MLVAEEAGVAVIFSGERGVRGDFLRGEGRPR